MDRSEINKTVFALARARALPTDASAWKAVKNVLDHALTQGTTPEVAIERALARLAKKAASRAVALTVEPVTQNPLERASEWMPR